MKKSLAIFLSTAPASGVPEAGADDIGGMQRDLSVRKKAGA